MIAILDVSMSKDDCFVIVGQPMSTDEVDRITEKIWLPLKKSYKKLVTMTTVPYMNGKCTKFAFIVDAGAYRTGKAKGLLEAVVPKFVLALGEEYGGLSPSPRKMQDILSSMIDQLGSTFK